MAYERINWENYPSTKTPRNATNLNKMDEGIYNTDTSISSGWINPNETWTYVSVDDPTGVIKVNADVTTKYSLGMRIKITNGGNTIFGILTKIGTYEGDLAGYTYLTFLHEIDPTDSLAKYLMQNSAITANYYSNMKVPYGFPLDETKWTVKFISTTSSPVINPTKNQWYNLSNGVINVPIGLWKLCVDWNAGADVVSASRIDIHLALSTSTSSESDGRLTSRYLFISLTGVGVRLTRENTVEITTKTPYYIIGKVAETTQTITYLNNDGRSAYGGNNIIKAVCAYL